MPPLERPRPRFFDEDPQPSFSDRVRSQIKNLATFIKGRADWRLVRGLAELQILTKASYVTLILVPILAGTWPAVRLVVNQYDKAVTEAAAIIDRATAQLSEVQSTLPGVVLKSESQQETAEGPLVLTPQNETINIKSLGVIVGEFKKHVAQYKVEYASATIASPQMPRAFAAAFTAALSVVLAHMLYEMFAPETLRRMTLDQYIAERRDDYSKHHSSDVLEQAIDTVRDAVFSETVRHLGSEIAIPYSPERKLWDDLKRRIRSLPHALKRANDSGEIDDFLRTLSPLQLQEIREFVHSLSPRNPAPDPFMRHEYS